MNSAVLEDLPVRSAPDVSAPFCSRCGSYDIRRVYHPTPLDKLASRFSLLALRCRACRRRFYGRETVFSRIARPLALLCLLLILSGPARCGSLSSESTSTSMFGFGLALVLIGKLPRRHP